MDLITVSVKNIFPPSKSMYLRNIYIDSVCLLLFTTVGFPSFSVVRPVKQCRS